MEKIRINNEECYVAFLDILGFKEYVKTTKPDDILKMFQELDIITKSLKKDIISFAETEEMKKKANTLPKELYLYIMSDSIILAIKCCHEGALHFLVDCCQKIQAKLLSQYHLTLRGGISKGIYYGDQTINFGCGMIKACELEEKAKYPRILIDKEILPELKATCIPFINCSNEIKTEVCTNIANNEYIDFTEHPNKIKAEIYVNVASKKYMDLSECLDFITNEKGKHSDKHTLEKYEWLEDQLCNEIEKNNEEIQATIAQEEFLKEEQSNENRT